MSWDTPLTSKEAGLDRFMCGVREDIWKLNSGLYLSMDAEKLQIRGSSTYFIVHMHHLGIWLKMQIWIPQIWSRIGGDTDADDAGLGPTQCSKGPGAFSNHSGKRSIDIERTGQPLHS